MSVSKKISILLLLVIFPSIAGAYNVKKCKGNNFKWNTTSIPLRTDSTSFPPGPWRDAIIESVDLWNRNASNLQFYLSHDDTSVGRWNGQNELWFRTSGNVGGAYVRYSLCSKFLPSRILEADIVYNISQSIPNALTHSKKMYDSMAYDTAAKRSIQTVTIHELGHGIGLSHTNDTYNMMGSDYSHVFVEGTTAYGYVGEDMNNGTVYLYGENSSVIDFGVVHWRWGGVSGEYSIHERTVMTNSLGQPVARAFSNEVIYILTPGQTVQVEFTYENNGSSTGSANIVPARFYVSTNELIGYILDTVHDIPILDTAFTLDRDTVLTTSTMVTIPTTLTPGVYYLGVKLDPDHYIWESEERNNTSYFKFYINN